MREAVPAAMLEAFALMDVLRLRAAVQALQSGLAGRGRGCLAWAPMGHWLHLVPGVLGGTKPACGSKYCRCSALRSEAASAHVAS